jgi:hypothetical protein
MFSKNLEEAVRELGRQFWLVQVDADTYSQDHAGMDEDFIRKLRRGMFDITSRDGERSEISDAIAECVATIERTCEPALRLEKLS